MPGNSQSCLTLDNPIEHSLPDSSVHGILQVRILEWVAFPSPGDPPNPGIKLTSPSASALQADSLPTEPPGELSRCLGICSKIFCTFLYDSLSVTRHYLS